MSGVLLDRSDVDPHQRLDKEALGEDWGEGFFVNPTPLQIQRDSAGSIVRASPIGDFAGMTEAMHAANKAAKEVAPVPTAVPVPLSDRQKIAELLANRLMEFYTSDALMEDKTVLNPVRDGIPVCDRHKDGCWAKCGAEWRPRKIQTTGGAVFEYLKNMVGARAQIVDSKQGYNRPKVLRINREVVNN